MSPDRATSSRRLVLAGTVLAWTALVLFLLGIGLALTPVQNRVDGRTAQDCGTPAAFVLSGRQEVQFASGGRAGLNERQAASANRHGCRSLAARRAIPAGALLLGTLLVGSVAFALTLKGRGGGATLTGDEATADTLGANIVGGPAAPEPPRPWGAPNHG